MEKTTLKDRMKNGQLWVNLLMACFALFFPPANEFLNKNPEMVAMVLGGMNMIFGFFSKKGAKLLE